MYEHLRGRVSRIISVGVSAIVGAFEGLSPEGMMEEAIKEVEAAGREVRDELDKVLAARHLAGKRLEEKNARLRELESQIAVAVRENRDDLAEAGIAQQLDIEAQLPVLSASRADLDAKDKELHSFIAALEAKKREMREELARLRAVKAPAAGIPDGEQAGTEVPGQAGGVSRKVSEASSAFERILARETGLPQRPDGALAAEAKLAELEKLSRENRIKERLAAFKAGQGQG